MTDNMKWVEQRYLAVSPFALTELNTPQSVLDGIYNGNKSAVSAGFPLDGKISFFRTSGEDIGDANTNLLKASSFDFPVMVYGIMMQVAFPRSIVDGADLKTMNGADLETLDGRRLASRYTRFFELWANNTMLVMYVAEDEVARVPLEWVGSGPSVWTEGLSISSGENETADAGGEQTFSPSVSAFSCRIGLEGKKDLWRFDVAGDDSKERKGLFIPEQRGFRVYTKTDPTIVSIINDTILNDEFLLEDQQIGIRITCGLFGDRTIQDNYGAT